MHTHSDGAKPAKDRPICTALASNAQTAPVFRPDKGFEYFLCKLPHTWPDYAAASIAQMYICALAGVPPLTPMPPAGGNFPSKGLSEHSRRDSEGTLQLPGSTTLSNPICRNSLALSQEPRPVGPQNAPCVHCLPQQDSPSHPRCQPDTSERTKSDFVDSRIPAYNR